ncbi:MAG TPA: 4a-hydroxytetrahydrobiopterin dehydratase [Candidatus Dormibacteraeota bacterium]|nr:4a-hydroxytetrahydrobiopterin dehydratase [Candidatus Dormibacteraeota bacterium]
MSELFRERCQACHGTVAPLPAHELQSLLPQLHRAWVMTERVLARRLETGNFALAFAIATEFALLAEREGHHPDLRVGWGYLEVELTTHQADGLTRNDFVMAAKIDRLVERGGKDALPA